MCLALSAGDRSDGRSLKVDGRFVICMYCRCRDREGESARLARTVHEPCGVGLLAAVPNHDEICFEENCMMTLEAGFLWLAQEEVERTEYRDVEIGNEAAGEVVAGRNQYSAPDILVTAKRIHV